MTANVAADFRCGCATPVVVVKAERKGAATSFCARCRRPIRLSL